MESTGDADRNEPAAKDVVFLDDTEALLSGCLQDGGAVGALCIDLDTVLLPLCDAGEGRCRVRNFVRAARSAGWCLVSLTRRSVQVAECLVRMAGLNGLPWGIALAEPCIVAWNIRQHADCRIVYVGTAPAAMGCVHRVGEGDVRLVLFGARDPGAPETECDVEVERVGTLDELESYMASVAVIPNGAT